MNTEIDNSKVAFMDGKTQNSPNSLVAADVPFHLIFCDFNIFVYLKNSLITSFAKYRKTYLIDLIELQISTLVWAWNILESIGL